MSARIGLPRPDGTTEDRTLQDPPSWPRPTGPFTSRVAYAAAHVVADPLGDNRPGAPAAVDWDATLAFRRHLWSYGFGVAEAMDTAQRGMGLDWACARELVARSAREAAACGGLLAAGVGTDHRDDLDGVRAVTGAYAEQLEAVESTGATAILMASRALVRVARGSEDYLTVYDDLLSQVRRPVILHWLGPMFDPLLAGYWGFHDPAEATAVVLELIRAHAGVVDGIKVSLLDAGHEVELRRSLPAGVRLYTGDDYHYPELIAGDGEGASDALLGIFAAIAPAASTALQALDRGDLESYHAALRPTVPLARHVFAPPTPYYKVGIAFLAWLNGHQRGLTMIGGLQSGRSLADLVETFRLADDAGLLTDPDLAVRRMRALLEVGGAA